MGRTIEQITAGLPSERREDVYWRERALRAEIVVRKAVEQAPTPVVIMPVGPQASGKSTFRDQYFTEPPRPVASVSTDDLIEAWAKERGLTYGQAFGKVDFGTLEKQAFSSFDSLVAAGSDIYVDRTNLTPKSRRRWLGRVQGTPLLKIAVVFQLPEHIIQRRLEKRSAETGKSISWHVVETAIKSMVVPTRDEGFDMIVAV